MAQKWTEEQIRIIHDHGFTDEEKSRLIHRSIACIRTKRLRLKPSRMIRRYSVTNGRLRRDFFNRWSRDSSYIAGFTCADGYFFRKGNGVGWSLHPIDACLLKRFKSVLRSGLPIRRYKYGKSPCARLEISDKELSFGLRKMGVSKILKTQRQRFPKVPTMMMSHFIRGVFDGDGGFCFRKTNRCRTMELLGEFTGNHRFITGLRRALISCLGRRLPKVKKIKNKNASRLSLRGKDAVDLGDLMYRRKGIFLNRKKKKWEKGKAYYKARWAHTSR